MTDLSYRLAFRNTVAVMAGLLSIVALSTIADGALQSKGIFPAAGQAMPLSLMLIALLYRFLFNAAGGWVTARLALEPRMRSVWILTGIVLALGVLHFGQGSTAPLWYTVAGIVAGPLATWGGGLIQLGRMKALKIG